MRAFGLRADIRRSGLIDPALREERSDGAGIDVPDDERGGFVIDEPRERAGAVEPVVLARDRVPIDGRARDGRRQ